MATKAEKDALARTEKERDGWYREMDREREQNRRLRMAAAKVLDYRAALDVAEADYRGAHAELRALIGMSISRGQSSFHGIDTERPVLVK